MFLQSAFIRIQSAEQFDRLACQLQSLGYKCFWLTHGGDYPTYLYTQADMGYYSDSDVSILRDPNIIDCGDNEELFWAIAALRDDTNKNQYFICIKSPAIWEWGIPSAGTMLKWIDKPYGISMTINGKWRKASVEELTSHFGEPKRK